MQTTSRSRRPRSTERPRRAWFKGGEVGVSRQGAPSLFVRPSPRCPRAYLEQSGRTRSDIRCNWYRVDRYMRSIHRFRSDLGNGGTDMPAVASKVREERAVARF